MTTSEIVAVAKLSDRVKELTTDEPGPSRFVQLLEARGLFKDAIQFLTHGLPIDVAIRWGCAAVRELARKENPAQSAEVLEAAEGWLKAPNDEERWKARSAAEKNGVSSPADLIAMAVFLSGGSITPAGTPVTPPPEYAANRMVGSGIQLAVLSQSPEKASERYRRALQIGREIVKTKS